jgi:hypothetical protein
VRAIQVAQLDMLSGSQKRMDYEDMARVEISRSGIDGGREIVEPLPLPQVTASK